jgi:hypothetical protein
LLFLFAGAAKAQRVVGPDAFPYLATDEAPFAFADISGTGTRVLAGQDDASVPALIGFDFSFYGTSHSKLLVSSNGLLAFGDPDPFRLFENRSLTATGALGVMPNLPLIAVLWDDWNFFRPGADAVYYQTLGDPGSQRFVVQWNNAVPFDLGTSPATFQAILFEGSNDILLQYADVITGSAATNNGASATVGIRDVSGNLNGRNLQWSFNQGIVRDGQAIRITIVPEPCSLLLLGAGILPLALYGRRRRNNPRG